MRGNTLFRLNVYGHYAVAYGFTDPYFTLSQQLMHLDIWSLEVKLAELLTLIPLVIPGMINALFFSRGYWF